MQEKGASPSCSVEQRMGLGTWSGVGTVVNVVLLSECRKGRILFPSGSLSRGVLCVYEEEGRTIVELCT